MTRGTLEFESCLSRALAFALRHAPEAWGIELDCQGWTDVRALIETLGLQINWQDRSAYGQLMKRLESLPEEIQATLPRKKEGGINGWSIFFAAKECGRFTAAELRSAMEECLTANRRLVTTGLDPKIVLNLLLLRILGEPPKKLVPKAAATKPPAAKR